ncbi:c-type cytochrome biogenesis protein CcmI [Actibacterium ureilyticum]|uniref:c-type cytochrome biogenesis protein CcmI n=1 Tax=Actibacterium ureilyticum TaxID=1590614 RepID=UPI000BAAC66F|nr:c-type cytochrome biogenesis protein CcmI [Actibacterium ureilyticum]
MTFWLIAAAMTVLSAAWLAWRMLRGRSGGQSHAAAFDLQVYRDQLREVERDLARGVLNADDAAQARTEISRKILEADRALQSGQDTRRAPRATSLTAVAALVGVMGGAVALYDHLGAPGYPDLPLAARKDNAELTRRSRPRQPAAEELAASGLPAPAPNPRLEELVGELRAVVAERPDDREGLRLLARNEAALGNFRAAYAAQSRLITLKGEAATSDDFSQFAELMVLATGGYVSPEAEQALARALELDPKNGAARYLSGLMLGQIGRPDLAFRYWRDLLENGPADGPWVPAIRAQIMDVAQLAGVEYQPPAPRAAPTLRGPDADAMAAAQDMTPEERMDMIRGMVSNLSERLATEGGAPQEWAQLLGALGVLEETEDARAIWTEAQQVFADDPEALEIVRAAAARAGVLE